MVLLVWSRGEMGIRWDIIRIRMRHRVSFLFEQWHKQRTLAVSEYLCTIRGTVPTISSSALGFCLWNFVIQRNQKGSGAHRQQIVPDLHRYPPRIRSL